MLLVETQLKEKTCVFFLSSLAQTVKYYEILLSLCFSCILVDVNLMNRDKFEKISMYFYAGNFFDQERSKMCSNELITFLLQTWNYNFVYKAMNYVSFLSDINLMQFTCEQLKQSLCRGVVSEGPLLLIKETSLIQMNLST